MQAQRSRARRRRARSSGRIDPPPRSTRERVTGCASPRRQASPASARPSARADRTPREVQVAAPAARLACPARGGPRVVGGHPWPHPPAVISSQRASLSAGHQLRLDGSGEVGEILSVSPPLRPWTFYGILPGVLPGSGWRADERVGRLAHSAIWERQTALPLVGGAIRTGAQRRDLLRVAGRTVVTGSRRVHGPRRGTPPRPRGRAAPQGLRARHRRARGEAPPRRPRRADCRCALRAGRADVAGTLVLMFP
jgi:hypothetical protein